MKRILTATALMTVIATGAFAATDFDTSAINEYVPEVDVSTLTDEQVAYLVGISGSADETDKERKMRAYLGDFVSPEVTTTVTVVPADEAPAVAMDESMTDEDGLYANTIAGYLPEVDQDTLTDEQKSELISIASGSENENTKKRLMEAYLMNSNG